MAITRYPTPSGGTYNATLTASVTSNVKGAYVELAASLPAAAKGVMVMIQFGSAAGNSWLIDLSVGAAASEVVVVADLTYSNGSASIGNQIGVYVPVALAASARLAARCACSGGSSRTIEIAVQVVDGTSSAVPTTYGAVSASSQGTSIDPGAAANTKGNYTQLTASTSSALDWLIVIATCANNPNPSSGRWAFDIATGAAASEVVVVPDCSFSMDSSFDTLGPNVFCFPISIASGTRLAARAQSTVTDATDRVFQVEVIGVTNSGMNGGSGGGGGGAFPFIG